MGILDQVTQMKGQGVPEPEITSRLMEQGISAKEISDAFNHAKIKSAVSNEPIEQEMESSVIDQPPEPPKPTYSNKNIRTKEMPEEDLYTPSPAEHGDFQEPIPPKIQEFPEEEVFNDNLDQNFDPQQMPPAQEFYPQEGYGDYLEGSNMANTDTMLEISEQVFSEKIKKFQKQLSGLNEFQEIAKLKLNDLSNRLKRIESSFDQLQSAIIQKVGNYGKSLETTRKEMDMMQDSFRKMVNPLAKRAPIKKKATAKKSIKRKPVSRKRK